VAPSRNARSCAAAKIGAPDLALGHFAAARSACGFPAGLAHQIFLLALTVLLTAILLMGMIYREKHGIANIGMESFMVLVRNLGAMALLFFFG